MVPLRATKRPPSPAGARCLIAPTARGSRRRGCFGRTAVASGTALLRACAPPGPFFAPEATAAFLKKHNKFNNMSQKRAFVFGVTSPSHESGLIRFKEHLGVRHESFDLRCRPPGTFEDCRGRPFVRDFGRC